MDMGTNGKFFKKITSLRKLKKEAKRRMKEILDMGGFRLKKIRIKTKKDALFAYRIARKQANREYSRKINDND